MIPPAADARAAASIAGRIRSFIEALVFVAAECAVLCDSHGRSAEHCVGASALILLFSLLGLPPIRARAGVVRVACADLVVLGTFAIVNASMSPLTLLVVASAFRNGMTLAGRRWLAFAAAEVVLLVAATVFVTHHRADNAPGWTIEIAGYAGVALALVLAAIQHANSARTAYEALALAHAELRRHVDRVGEVSALRERERIALQIHDSLGHELTTLAIHLEAAQTLVYEDHCSAASYLSRAHAMSLQTLAAVRRSVRNISSDPLEQDALDTAIRRLCERFGRMSGIELTVFPNRLPVLSPSETTHVVNIVREALTNVARHAGAKRIVVRAETAPGQLTMQVQDDGRGFDPRSNESGQGLRGMHSRAREIGATIEIRTNPSAGCTVHLVVPLHTGSAPR